MPTQQYAIWNFIVSVPMVVCSSAMLVCQLYAAEQKPAITPQEDVISEELKPKTIRAENGFAYRALLALKRRGDHEGLSECILLEDGKPLSSPHSPAKEIETAGNGRYSHWTEASIVFSTSDNSDPRTNGRKYALVSPRRLSAQFRIFIIGDSTAASFQTNEYPLTGWGQKFPDLFTDKVEIDNRALSSRSTKSFRDDGSWGKMIAHVKAGDYVLIQFGHNDEEKAEPAKYTDPDTSFRANLKQFIDEIRAKEGIPVLITPVGRRTFDAKGVFVNSHAAYQQAIVELGKAEKVPVVDLTEKSRQLFVSLGAEPAKQLFNYTEPGQYPGYPKGNKDDTHFCEHGAIEIGKLVLEGLKELNIPFVMCAK